jgi:cytochrome c oxidase cbb3-type subunit 3
MRRDPEGRLSLVALACAAALTALPALAQPRPGATQPGAPPPTGPGPEAMLQVPVTGLIPGATGAGPAIRNPVADDPAAAQRGMTHFAAFNCIGCHADNGGGGMGPALSNRQFIYGADPANLYLSIAQGRPNGMPAWGAMLPEAVIWDLVAYVRGLSDVPKEEWGRTVSATSPALEQVPAESMQTARPWEHTRKFSSGQKP